MQTPMQSMPWKRYGCTEQPFRAGFDERFVYPGNAVRETLARLRRRIAVGAGLSLVTGPPGIGKTTLLRKLVAGMEGSNTLILFLTAPVPGLDAVARLCAEQLGTSVDGERADTDPTSLCKDLLSALEPGRHRILIVDEAQALPDDVLADLLSLATPGEDGRVWLPTVLAGEPSLGERLAKGPLAGLDLSVAARCALGPLTRRETAALVRHRLRAAGCTGCGPFAPAALERIARYAKGVPGTINSLCRLALFFAAQREEAQIDVEAVEAAACAALIDDRPLRLCAATAPGGAVAAAHGGDAADEAALAPPPGVARRGAWIWPIAVLAGLFFLGSLIPFHPEPKAVSAQGLAPPAPGTREQTRVASALPSAPAPQELDPAMEPGQLEIGRLLALARQHLNADRLVAPRFDNALALYRKVLQADPGNPQALTGLAVIKSKLGRYAQARMAQGDRAGAERQLEKVRSVEMAEQSATLATAARNRQE